MFYDRQIKYLEDRKDGERIQTAGFVKAEVRGELCRISIRVSGLRGTDTFEKNIFAQGGGQEGKLCKIKIVGGRGDTGELSLHSGHLGETGIAYEELEEIRIPLAAGRELLCLWGKKGLRECGKKSNSDLTDRVVLDLQEKEAGKDKAYKGDGMEKAAVAGSMGEAGELPSMSAESPAAGESTENREPQKAAESPASEESTERRELGEAAESPKSKDMENRMMKENAKEDFSEEAENGNTAGNRMKKESALKNTEREISTAERSGNADSAPVCRPPMEDKWQQISAIYPRITPFEDEREYISIGPEDFVIFPAKYYQLVNNSFLLHGYHNYKHLILVRIERRGEIRYYVGVPGIYHEKEKQVAIMFGFESFESKTEPVQSGDYGYYMIRIEL